MGDTAKPSASNAVHDAKNWTDRILVELQATEDWYNFYGFLADGTGDANAEKRIAEEKVMLHHARRGPVGDYLVNEYKKEYGDDEAVDAVHNAPMSLTRELAQNMRSQELQALGGSLKTSGMDPIKKYSVPLTTSQQIGWLAAKHGSLEVFEPVPSTDNAD